jgi:hypothetical protein
LPEEKIKAREREGNCKEEKINYWIVDMII